MSLQNYFFSCWFLSDLLSSIFSDSSSEPDNLVVLIETDDIEIILDDSSPVAAVPDRRSSHGRYSKFGEVEAALLADEASDGPVLYKASVEKKIHTSLAFYAEFKAMSTLSFDFEALGPRHCCQ